MEEKKESEDWYVREPCKNWEDFLQKVKEDEKKERMKFRGWGGFLYRGQSESDEQSELQSGIDRAVDASAPLKHKRWKYEAAILREFMRRAHQYEINVPDEFDRLEWLALMRHYGAPTRLVDCTYSHYIAAYFAFSRLGKKPREVWAISLGWLRKETTERFGKIDLSDSMHFRKYFLSYRSPKSFVAALNAERMNRRLTIQQGVFLCPGNIELPFKENLKSMNPPKRSIVKFVIQHEERNKALTELKHMNISKATLFPDLGGFAESLNDRFELLFKDYHILEENLRKVVASQKRTTSV